MFIVRCYVYGVLCTVFHVQFYIITWMVFVYHVSWILPVFLVPWFVYGFLVHGVSCKVFLYGGSCTVFCVQHFVYRVPCIRYRLPCTVNKVLNLSLQVSASLERYSFSNILACIGINTSHLYITLQYNLFNLRNDRGWLPK